MDPTDKNKHSLKVKDGKDFPSKWSLKANRRS
jgi:hypothetical protein